MRVVALATAAAAGSLAASALAQPDLLLKARAYCAGAASTEAVEKLFGLRVLESGGVPPGDLGSSCKWTMADRGAPPVATLSATATVVKTKTRADIERWHAAAPNAQPVPGGRNAHYFWHKGADGPRRTLIIKVLRKDDGLNLQLDVPDNLQRAITSDQVRQGFSLASMISERM
jgi:hypothetical protein